MTDISLELIYWHPQVRKTFGEESLLSLAQTIKQHGVKQPIGVYREGERYIGIYGQRRYEASKLAGKVNIPCAIHEKPADDADTVEIQLLENIARENLNPIEEAAALSQLMTSKGYSASQLAMRVGLQPSHVSKSLKLLELPEPIQQLVGGGAGRIGASAAYELTRVNDPQQQAELAARLCAGELTRDGVSGVVKNSKTCKGTKPSGDTSRLVLTIGQGRTLTLAGRGLESIEAVVSWLEELLPSARKARTQGLSAATYARALKDQAGR